MSSQDRTLDRYQELMQINAASHLLRAARELGLFDALRGGQKTEAQLVSLLSIRPQALRLLLESLISMSVIEKYGDDHALAPVMQLLCQYDADLGDAMWGRLAATSKEGGEEGQSAGSTDDYLDGLTATQWVHTPAAMQVAEMLDLGGGSVVQEIDVEAGPDGMELAIALGRQESAPSGEGSASRPPLRILDLGCGSAVWSCAMAYRDGRARVTAIDTPARLAAATSTAESIRLGDRFEAIAGDPDKVELPPNAFDLVVIAQRLHATDSAARERLLDRAREALATGGRIVLIDLFRGPAKARLAETIEALKIFIATPGEVQSAEDLREKLLARGLTDIRFSFIAASRINLGLVVASERG